MRIHRLLVLTVKSFIPATLISGALLGHLVFAEDGDPASPNDALNELQQSLKNVETDIAESNPLRGKITRAVFTHAIDGYDPVDEIISISVKNRKVYFFTDLQGMKGEKIVHRWEFNNVVKASVEFEIAAERYRIHSSKIILPDEVGEWSVVVTNKNGQVLARNKITVVP